MLSFAAAIEWPLALYLYFVHPDWSWLYLVDPARLPRSVSILVLAGVLAATLAGYGVGWRLSRLGKLRALAATLGGAALVLAAFAIALRGRLGSYATYHEFHAGHSLPLGEVKLGWVLIAGAAGFLIAGGAVAWTLWAAGSRAATAKPPGGPADAPEVSAPLSQS